MSATTVKQGDTLQAIARQVLLFNVPFDLTDPRYLVLTSGRDSNDPVSPLYFERDVTTRAKANGDPQFGTVGLPIFDGSTLPSVETAPVVTSAGNSTVLVTATPGPTGTTRQRLYMSRSTGTELFLVADGTNGFMDGPGILVGVAPYDLASDADLLGPAPTEDESQTNGQPSLGVPTTPIAVVQAGVGTITDGSHTFALVNDGLADTVKPRIILFEIVIRDAYTLRDFTFPQSGFEELHVVEDIE